MLLSLPIVYIVKCMIGETIRLTIVLSVIVLYRGQDTYLNINAV